MEYIHTLNNKIDLLLDNNLFYSSTLLLLIVFITFSTGLKSKIKLDLSNSLIKLLFVLLIIYCSTKDIRICVLLLILFLVELDKENEEKINDKMIQLLIKDAALENKK